jgi:DNA invertase Pin-like site-specific DNA recombinase
MASSMLVGYARVSSVGQTLDLQLEQLTAAGCEKIFSEKKSGRSKEGRAALQEALEFIRDGDVLLVTRLDRLARSVGDLRDIVDRLTAKGAGFRCLQQGTLDTTRSDGKLLLNILASFAEFEADIRRERQRDGIERVKREAPERYRGRRPTVDVARIRDLHASGMGPSAIAKETGYGRMTIWRALKPAEGAP